jgi:predicted amidophosphoribosyltransferase
LPEQAVDAHLGPGRAGGPALPPVWALARYADPVRSALLAGKERGRRELPALLGVALGRGLLRLLRIGVLTAEL